MSATTAHHNQQEAQQKPSFGERFLNMFLCCSSSDTDSEDDYPRKPLQIGSPTNFRRHELDLPGLSPDLQDRYRRKQQEDAIAMFADLRPLQSSPSSQFAERPPTRITYEQFTQPRAAPSPMSPSSTSRHSAGQKMASHARKLSGSLTGGRKQSGGGVGDVEMWALMEPSRTEVNVQGPPEDVGGLKRGGEMRGSYKMSEDSLDSRDDSAKGGIGKF